MFDLVAIDFTTELAVASNETGLFHLCEMIAKYVAYSTRHSATVYRFGSNKLLGLLGFFLFSLKYCFLVREPD